MIICFKKRFKRTGTRDSLPIVLIFILISSAWHILRGSSTLKLRHFSSLLIRADTFFTLIFFLNHFFEIPHFQQQKLKRSFFKTWHQNLILIFYWKVKTKKKKKISGKDLSMPYCQSLPITHFSYWKSRKKYFIFPFQFAHFFASPLILFSESRQSRGST